MRPAGPSAPDGAGPGVGGRPRVVRPVGDRAVLVECTDLAEVMALHGMLSTEPLDGQADVQAGAATVLVLARRPQDAVRLRAVLAVLATPASSARPGREVVAEVLYDGADLDDVAAATGLSREAVVAAHSAEPWTAAFGGFAPGFVYLTRSDRTLDVPRRATPRPRVPAGSVALAAGYSAVYPHSSPGGWQLLGRTDARVWDVQRDPPSWVLPGDRVRFRPVRALGTGPAVRAQVSAGAPPADVPGPGGGLLVTAPGPLALVQDRGRPGRRDLGVTPSGAADRGSAARANRLVGNPGGAAVLETVLGGLQLQAVGSQVVAVTGAPAPLTVHDGHGGTRPERTGAPVRLRDGETLALGDPPVGLRCYVAVRGGLAVPAVLGSRSTDVLSGLGPEPLAAGDLLPVGAPPGDAVAPPEPADGTAPDPSTPLVVRVVLGPRDDWFTEESVDLLLATTWTITPESNRVGLRLDGAALVRRDDRELPSEGTVAGALQVPASGRPVLLLADHPVSGGYPVVAVVRTADLDGLAQLRPGDRLRLAL